MHRAAPLFALSLAPALLAACSNSHGGFPEAQRGYAVDAQLQFDGEGSLIPETVDHHFTLNLAPREDGDGLQVVAGSAGSMMVTTATSKSGLTQITPADEPSSRLRVGWARGLQGHRAFYEQITLDERDTDGDGTPDQITGDASGTMVSCGGDVCEEREFTATLEGVTDEEPPELRLTVGDRTIESGATDAPAVGRVRIEASEPLPLTRAQLLDVEGGEVVAEVDGHGDGPAWAFWSYERVPMLPFDTKLEVVFPEGSSDAPSPLDMNGNTVTSVTTLRTVAAPGVFPEDGFEGTSLEAVLTGEARVVEAGGDVAPLAGDRSLYIGGPATVTMRLPVEADDTAVRMDVGSNSGSSSWSWLDARVIAPEAGTVERGRLDEYADDATAPQSAVSIPLPEGAGSTVVLYLRSRFMPPAPAPRALIDGLRVEP